MRLSRWIGWVTLAWLAAMAGLGVASRVPAFPPFGPNEILESLGHIGAPCLLAALLTGWLTIRRGMERVPGSLVAAGLSSGLALAIEALQLLRPDRSVESLDTVLSLVGAGAGALAYLGLTRQAERVGPVSATVTGLGVLATILTAATFIVQPTIRHVCNGEPPIAALEELATKPGNRVAGGLVVEYRFEEGEGRRTGATGGLAAPLDLLLGDGVDWLPGGSGIRLEEPVGRVRSTEPAAGVIEAILRSGSFTIEAWVAPDRPQSGPARIITISSGTSLDDIDLQLGQEGTCLSHRIRFGTETEWVVVEGAFAGTARRHVAVTFAGAETRSYVNGRLIDVHSALDEEPSGWNHAHRLLIGNEETGNRVFAGEVFLVAIYDRSLDIDEISANFRAGPRPDS